MIKSVYHCPTCEAQLELYANGDDGPADDRWTCDVCGIEYPHNQFPLPPGYVKQARAAIEAQDAAWAREKEERALAAWNAWARGQWR